MNEQDARAKIIDMAWGEEYPEGIKLSQVMEACRVPVDKRDRIEGSKLHAIIRSLKLERRRIKNADGDLMWVYVPTTLTPPPQIVEPIEPNGIGLRDREWRLWWDNVAKAAGLRQSWFDENLPPPDRKGCSWLPPAA